MASPTPAPPPLPPHPATASDAPPKPDSAPPPPPPPPAAFASLANAIRTRVRALLRAAGFPAWFSPADLAAILAGAGAGSTLTLLFQPLLGAWVFAEGCFYVWQSYRCEWHANTQKNAAGRELAVRTGRWRPVAPARAGALPMPADHPILERVLACTLGVGGRRDRGGPPRPRPAAKLAPCRLSKKTHHRLSFSPPPPPLPCARRSHLIHAEPVTNAAIEPERRAELQQVKTKKAREGVRRGEHARAARCAHG